MNELIEAAKDMAAALELSADACGPKRLDRLRAAIADAEKLAALDILVVNTDTGNVLGAFMLPEQAVGFLAANTHGNLSIRNADGSLISRVLSERIDAINKRKG